MSDDARDVAEFLGGLFARSNAETAQAEQIYQALKERRVLAQHRAVAYRCARGCLLLDVLVTPVGTVIHHPPYRMSPTMNAAESTAEGRRANTTDGARRWKGWTAMMVLEVDVSVSCNHVHRTLGWAEMAAAIEAKSGTITM